MIRNDTASLSHLTTSTIKMVTATHFLLAATFFSFLSVTFSWQIALNSPISHSVTGRNRAKRGSLLAVNELIREVATIKETTVEETTVEETTEKYGLEAGLIKSVQSKDGGTSAKELLKKYGIAYLATSIPLSMLSFTLCYLLVDSGVDVNGLLSNVGIEVTANTGMAGTVAIAYAAHKASSPIRFPPTVLLTPVVAKLIGKEAEESQ